MPLAAVVDPTTGKIVNVIVADPANDKAPQGYVLKPVEEGAPTHEGRAGPAKADTRYEWSEAEQKIVPNAELKAQRAAQEVERQRVEGIIAAEVAKDPDFWAKVEADPEYYDRVIEQGGR